MEKKDCSFFHEPWEATVGRSPYNSLALPHRGYRLHTSCALNNDVPERQWLKESMCDTRSSSSKLQQQVTGEKWGQKKQVSAGNERKEGGKNAQDYRQKNKRGGVEIPHRCSQSSSWSLLPWAGHQAIATWYLYVTRTDSEANGGSLHNSLGPDGWNHKTSTWGLGMGKEKVRLLNGPNYSLREGIFVFG